MISTADLIVLVSTVATCMAALVGVELYLARQLSIRLEKVEGVVRQLESWHELWTNMPADSSSATMLDRRLSGIEHRLDQIESHMERTPHNGP